MAAACPFPGVQGSQVLIQELITGLAARGHRIDLVTYPFGMDAQWRCPRGCRIHRVNTRLRYPAHHPGLHPVKPLLDAALARLLEEVVRRRGADLIHAHSVEGLMAALWVRRQTRTPVLYHSHTLLGEELPTYYRPGPVRFLSKWAGLAADRLLPPRADHCIALSPRAARTFQKMGVRGDRISCLPPFVFSPPPDAGPSGGGSGPGAPYVLYAGNLHPYQDLDLLLRSFRIVAAAERETHLLIVTHNDPSRWEKRMGRMGLEGRVTFLIGRSFEQEWEWMSDAAVLALPRLCCPGYPMKLLNYLAAARPIVASADSARGLTHGRDAYVVTAPGPEAFARGLLRVLRSRPLALRLAEGAGRTSKESLSPRNLLGGIERVYEQVSPPSRIWISRMAAAAV